ncbi:MAG: hypothetical protein ACRDAM_09445 [Casimicrobium sp.]
MKNFIDAIARLQIDADIAETNGIIAMQEGREADAKERLERAEQLRRAEAALIDLQAGK